MRKQKKRKSVVGVIVKIILVLVLALGAGGFFFYKKSLDPVNKGKQEVFVIEEGQDFSSVLDNLEKERWIQSAFIAKLYAKIHHDSAYYAGNFSLDDSMSTPEILDYISNIKNAKSDSVTMTIPEGLWAKQIAQKIEETFGYSQEEIIEKWNDADYIKELSKDYPFLDAKALNNKEYRVKLEGYLFPETYSLNADASIDEITRTMLDQFGKVYDTYKDDFDKSQYSVHELVTLASVVQFESGYESDMPTIAGVFYNRLNKGMKLQSSVTVCYALYDDFDDPTACEVKVDIDSPYNTYMVDGLPVGPILNPGQEAIKAVLEPEKTDYLYFLADIHGDGKVYYSKTLEEHEEKMKELGLEL